ncbi:MAG: hypothetical protein AAB683_01875 [Patescibacteria group bacterium]
MNQWLCIALISLMTFWTVLYYATNKAQAIANQMTDYGDELNNL